MTPVAPHETEQALRVLRDLIRIDTTNPPGNELPACLYLKNLLEAEGIACRILESAPGRGNLVARLAGDGSRKPLLLTSHLDVVPAEREFWSRDPFGGEIADGCVWGRGAVDMKQMTALELAVFLKAKKENWPLKRDLILCAVADEEAGCRHGSKWLVENHPDLIRAEYALNEVGGFSLDVDGIVFYPIGVAEKGVCWFEIVAKGRPGHGAMPHDDQAIEHVCLAAHKLARAGLKFRKTPLVERFVGSLAEHLKFPKNLVLKSLTNPFFSDFVLAKVLPDKERARNFRNMLRDLATPTKLAAGYKENVIPARAAVTCDGRILPGQTVQGFLAEVRELIGPGFELNVLHAEEPCAIEDYDDVFFRTLGDSLKKHDPGCVPVPFLIPGYTDAKNYSKLGVKCYGFAPTKLPPELNFGQMYHGHDERLPVSAIGFGLNALADAVFATCCEG